jgi:hypothetical protein
MRELPQEDPAVPEVLLALRVLRRDAPVKRLYWLLIVTASVVLTSVVWSILSEP